MPEANTSPRTEDETTAPAARAGAAAAAGSREEDPVAASAPGRKPRERAPEGPADGQWDGQVREEAEDFGAAGGAADPENAGEAGEAGEPGGFRTGLTPRQARRVRIVVSGIVMAAVAVALAVRLRSAPSVLTVGFYGIALILYGVAIGLSRRGRTRVATGVLVLGFAPVALAEWLLASVE